MWDAQKNEDTAITPRKTIILFLAGLLSATFIASAVQTIRFYTSTAAEQEEYEQLLAAAGGAALPKNPAAGKGNLLLIPVGDPTSPHIRLTEIEEPPEDGEQTDDHIFPIIQKYDTGMRIDFPTLYAINSDVIGWIRIPGTGIDYPVTQGTDNEYYLKHSFTRKDTSAGCIFADYANRCGRDPNIVLYGHNMGRSSKDMFSGLLAYYDEAFWQEHKNIFFDTIYGCGLWEVIAVYMFNVNDIAEFNYTQETFGGEMDFLAHVKKTRQRQAYDTGVQVAFGDQLLTLSTCDRQRYGSTGRCVVVAKKIASEYAA